MKTHRFHRWFFGIVAWASIIFYVMIVIRACSNG